MSDEPTISTREYIESLIESRFRELTIRCNSLEEATKVAFSSSEKAISKAEDASNHRFEGINEFRGQLADQQRTLVARVEVDALLTTLRDAINVVQAQVNEARAHEALLLKREAFDEKMKELAKAEDIRRETVDARFREVDRFRWIAIGLGAGAGGFAGWIARLLV